MSVCLKGLTEEIRAQIKSNRENLAGFFALKIRQAVANGRGECTDWDSLWSVMFNGEEMPEHDDWSEESCTAAFIDKAIYDADHMDLNPTIAMDRRKIGFPPPPSEADMKAEMRKTAAELLNIDPKAAFNDNENEISCFYAAMDILLPGLNDENRSLIIENQKKLASFFSRQIPHVADAKGTTTCSWSFAGSAELWSWMFDGESMPSHEELTSAEFTREFIIKAANYTENDRNRNLIVSANEKLKGLVPIWTEAVPKVETMFSAESQRIIFAQAMRFVGARWPSDKKSINSFLSACSAGLMNRISGIMRKMSRLYPRGRRFMKASSIIQ